MRKIGFARSEEPDPVEVFSVEDFLRDIEEEDQRCQRLKVAAQRIKQHTSWPAQEVIDAILPTVQVLHRFYKWCSLATCGPIQDHPEIEAFQALLELTEDLQGAIYGHVVACIAATDNKNDPRYAEAVRLLRDWYDQQPEAPTAAPVTTDNGQPTEHLTLDPGGAQS